MPAYYNEIDAYAAQYLRNLIAAGHIAPGDVDERSIEDVKPDDLRAYEQCHFFAGLGAWSYALRGVGWRDDQRIWTGSCPCQPFSAAGKGAGFDDERHLWPDWFHLIAQCEPAIVVGEQVASSDANAWIDLVQANLEALGFAVGAVAFPSAGVGAPHIRDRTYWVAHAPSGGRPNPRGGDFVNGAPPGWQQSHSVDQPNCEAGGVADTNLSKPQFTAGERPGPGEAGSAGAHRQPDGRSELVKEQSPAGPVNGYWRAADWLACRDGKWRPVEPGTFPLAHGAPARVGRLRAYGNAINVEAGGLADSNGSGLLARSERREAVGHGATTEPNSGLVAMADEGRPGPVNGYWRAADWLFCRDGKWRPVEPGTFPLAHGAPARVGRLRAYGNAINVEAAKVFLRSALL